MLNKKMYSNNKLNAKGISKAGNKYVARIQCKGVSHYLGRFSTLEEAVNKRIEAEKELFKEFRRELHA